MLLLAGGSQFDFAGEFELYACKTIRDPELVNAIRVVGELEAGHRLGIFILVEITEFRCEGNILAEFDRRFLSRYLELRFDDERRLPSGDERLLLNQEGRRELDLLLEVFELDGRREAPVGHEGRPHARALLVRREGNSDFAVLVGLEHGLAEAKLRPLHDRALLVEGGEDVSARVMALEDAQASLPDKRTAGNARAGQFDDIHPRFLQLGKDERLGVADDRCVGREVDGPRDCRNRCVEVDVALHLPAENLARAEGIEGEDGKAHPRDVLHVHRKLHVVVRGKGLGIRVGPL